MNTLYQHLAGESLHDERLPGWKAASVPSPADADLRAAFVQFLTLERQLDARPDPAEKLAGAEAAGETHRHAAGAVHQR